MQVFRFNCVGWEEDVVKPKTFILQRKNGLLDLRLENFSGTVPTLIIMDDFHEMYSDENFCKCFFKEVVRKRFPLLKIICLSTYGAVSQPYSPFAPYFSNLTLVYKDFFAHRS